MLSRLADLAAEVAEGCTLCSRAGSRDLWRLKGWDSALVALGPLCTVLLESPRNLQQLAPLGRVRHAQVDEILIG